MNLSQKVVLNTAVQIGSKAITAIFGLLVTILLTGYLGVEGFGSYMYVISLAIIFGSFSDWGTSTIGAREASRDKDNQDKILSEVLILRFLTSIAVSLLMFSFSFIFPLKFENEVAVRQMIRVGAVLLILLTTKGSLTVIFQTKLKLQKQALVDFFISILILFFTWLFIFLKLDLFLIFSSFVFANLLGVFLGIVFALKTFSFKFSFRKEFLVYFLKESFPMGAVLLMFTIDNKIDTVMLGVIKGDKAVGIYSAAYRVYDVLILGAAYFMIALLPVLSRYSFLSKWRIRLKKIYEKSFLIMLFLAIIVFSITFLFAPLIIKIITQSRFNEFFDSILIIKLLSIAMFFSYINHMTGYTIVALRKQKQYFLIALFSVAFNVVANLFAINKYSYNGAAVVTILTEFFVFILTSIFIRKVFGFSPNLKKLPKTLVELIKNHGKIF